MKLIFVTMSKAEKNIARCLLAIEDKLDWGPSAGWTHQDFVRLSEQIQEETGHPLSYVTLKRVWGKVAYESSPAVNTLDVLAQFVAHENWRAFVRTGGVLATNKVAVKRKVTKGQWWQRWQAMAGALGLAVMLILLFPGHKEEPTFNPDDFHFFSKKTRTEGVPNSVVFEIDAGLAPFDSIEVQQSWDTRRRVRLPRSQQYHTSIYYYPGFYLAKLLVGGAVVKEHALHILSDDWYGAIVQEPVPVYLPPRTLRKEGKLAVYSSDIAAHGIPLEPVVPLVRLGLAQDFEGLNTDNFHLRVRLRNTYAAGSGACQETYVYVMGEGSIIKVPLLAMGCIAASNLRVMQYNMPGNKYDLSAFGVDFSEEVLLEIVARKGVLKIFVNNKEAYQTPGQVKRQKISALDFRFSGGGEVEKVLLGSSEGEWIVEENFNEGLGE
ncbi:MAG: hypothetical protein ACRBG0_08620 [Lewinella sp.]|uniref:hypothetical protein n=1 Tax=Lewinella sp. TaxID=2004506 RepID=UPI003D6C222A